MLILLTMKEYPDAWCQTYTGKKFYPLEPNPEDVDIIDIAWALSNQCRFTGHSNRFYSIAEHSIYVARYCSPENKLWGLLHDASEAYISDISSPLKMFLPDYRNIEHNLMVVICDRFGLDWKIPEQVKKIDMKMLATEQGKLMGTPPEEWDLPYPPYKEHKWTLEQASQKAVFNSFMGEFFDFIYARGY